MLKNPKTLLIGSALILTLIIGLFLSWHKPSSPTPVQTQFNGFDQLTAVGISRYQVQSLQFALGEYIKTQHLQVRTVAIVPNSVKVSPHNRDNLSPDIANFDVRLDNTFLHAKMEYSLITKIRLYLYSQDGQSLKYDSRDIDQFGSESD